MQQNQLISFPDADVFVVIQPETVIMQAHRRQVIWTFGDEGYTWLENEYGLTGDAATNFLFEVVNVSLRITEYRGLDWQPLHAADDAKTIQRKITSHLNSQQTPYIRAIFKAVDNMDKDFDPDLRPMSPGESLAQVLSSSPNASNSEPTPSSASNGKSSGKKATATT